MFFQCLFDFAIEYLVTINIYPQYEKQKIRNYKICCCTAVLQIFGLMINNFDFIYFFSVSAFRSIFATRFHGKYGGITTTNEKCW